MLFFRGKKRFFSCSLFFFAFCCCCCGRKQAEKVKTGRELCLGLDEAGNDLGDISLGFFLRQDKAVKARKMSGDDADSRMGTLSSPAPVCPPSSRQKRPGQPRQQFPEHRAGGFQSTATAAANATAAAPPATAPAGVAASCAASAATSAIAHGAQEQSQGIDRGGESRSPANSATGLQVAWAPSLPEQQPKPHCSWGAGFAREKEEDVSGGGAEARAVVASSGEARGPAARGGGLTVVIPPAEVMAGHLRSPSEVMLDDIADSLADTKRKPSFAKMQSVQVSALCFLFSFCLPTAIDFLGGFFFLFFFCFVLSFLMGLKRFAAGCEFSDRVACAITAGAALWLCEPWALASGT